MIEQLKLRIKILKELIELYQKLLAQKRLPKIIIHHTATNRDNTTFKAIDYNHQIRWGGKSKSQMGMYCGYQYLITGDGKIHQARLDTEQGWHCKRYNFNTIGIALTGNFMREQMSEAQINSLEKLLREKLEKYHLNKNRIKLHRNFKMTLCPGNNLADWIDDYKSA